MKRVICLSLLRRCRDWRRSTPVARRAQGCDRYRQRRAVLPLDLPVTIYATAVYDDLNDVRVRNGAGSLVPHAWLNGTETEVQVDSYAGAVLRRARARQGAGGFDAGVQAHHGALMIPKAIKTDPERVTTDWIVDAGHVQGRLLQLRLTLDAQAEGLFPLGVEASDDLRRWRTVAGNGADCRVAARCRARRTTRRRTARNRSAFPAPALARRNALAPALAAVTLDSAQDP